jgi:hypothetical protein
VRRIRADAGWWAHRWWFFLGFWLVLALIGVAAYLLGR